MSQENNNPSYLSQAFLTNAYEPLNEFKKLSSNNIRTLMEDFIKLKKLLNVHYLRVIITHVKV
ncbi:hypothetical protein BTU51_0819 [Rickettsia rickettsii]|uniref:Uncharacterized protein n=2 Tax=Rickettsia rickettsii TaxID=783 RepID=B0BXT1_RICRO|nr:hypothetical protein A1G_03900 [Rickettsia rickettsii str. 'Sheila Smith']ABY72657.1 hypothetical protein RrIowa_0819 [Rickettsia rickettsii str. Iowa]APU55607.1 hypothetical protein BTU50_0819 [Rickettsia rickettsii]APU56984.1 hypothetical protein BTU51_0819 [Rickettsia rickettsii]